MSSIGNPPEGQSPGWQSNLEHAYCTSKKGDGVTPGEQLTSTCLAPLRYFAGGKRAEIVERENGLKEINFTKSQVGEEKTTWKTIAMIAAIVPGLAVGSIGLAINYLNHDPKREEILQNGVVGETTTMQGTVRISTQETEVYMPPVKLDGQEGLINVDNPKNTETIGYF
jgi:hypothetical protein